MTVPKFKKFFGTKVPKYRFQDPDEFGVVIKKYDKWPGRVMAQKTALEAPIIGHVGYQALCLGEPLDTAFESGAVASNVIQYGASIFGKKRNHFLPMSVILLGGAPLGSGTTSYQERVIEALAPSQTLLAKNNVLIGTSVSKLGNLGLPFDGWIPSDKDGGLIPDSFIGGKVLVFGVINIGSMGPPIGLLEGVGFYFNSFYNPPSSSYSLNSGLASFSVNKLLAAIPMIQAFKAVWWFESTDVFSDSASSLFTAVEALRSMATAAGVDVRGPLASTFGADFRTDINTTIQGFFGP